jgi:hypothetical protein
MIFFLHGVIFVESVVCHILKISQTKEIFSMEAISDKERVLFPQLRGSDRFFPVDLDDERFDEGEGFRALILFQ